MNKEEATKFLAMIKVAYPSTYKDIDKDTAIATVNMWQLTFENVPLFIMEMAFDHYRKVSEFAPTPASIIKELKGLYYTALSDAFTLNSASNQEMCEYILEHTKCFNNVSEIKINYGALNKNLLEPKNKYQHLIGGVTQHAEA